MRKQSHYFSFRKLISILVSITFMFNQISWAGDLTSYTVHDLINRQEKDQETRFSPDYIKSRDRAVEDLLSLNQEIENWSDTDVSDSKEELDETALDLTGPRGTNDSETKTLQEPLAVPLSASAQDNEINTTPIVITTSEGDKIEYLGSDIVSIEKTDGTIIRGYNEDHITVNADNNLIRAEIKYTDGTILYFDDGHAQYAERTDGTIIEYDDSDRIERVILSGNDSEILEYTYIPGKIIEYSYLKEDGVRSSLPYKTSYYDESGTLEKVLYHDTGKTIEYEDGILSRIKDEDGNTHVFESEEYEENGNTYFRVRETSLIENNGDATYIYTYIRDDDGIEHVKVVEYANDEINLLPTDYVSSSSRWFQDGNALYTYWRYEYLYYDVDFGNTAPVVMNISTMNVGTLPNDFPGYELKVYIDGEYKGMYLVPANDTEYQEGSIDLGILEGSHRISIVWVNDYCDGTGDANIKIGGLSFDVGREQTIHYYDDEGFIESSIACGQNNYKTIYDWDHENNVVTSLYADMLYNPSADVDNDGAVGFMDYLNIKMGFGPSVDIDGDGDFDSADFDEFEKAFGTKVYNRTESGYIPDNTSIFSLPDHMLADNHVKSYYGDYENGFDEIVYDDTGNISAVLKPNGDTVAYGVGDELALPSEIITNGVSSQFNYTFDSMNQLNSIEIERDGVKRLYDEYGNLSGITKDDLVIDFGQSGEVYSIVDGNNIYLYDEDTNLSSIVDDEDVEYVLDNMDRVSQAIYPDGRIYEYTYDVGVNDIPIVIVNDCQSGNTRYYRNDLLYYQIDPALQLETFYTYVEIEDENKLSHVTQKKGDKALNEFLYTYPQDNDGDTTRIEDILNNEVRTYSADGKIQEYHDSQGHVYKYSHSDDGGMVTELAELHKDDGRIIYYVEGAVDHVYCPREEVTIKNIEFNQDGQLSKFTLVLPNNELRTCTTYGDWTYIISPSDGTRLVYKDDRLIAINSSGKLFKFQDDQIPDDIPLVISEDPAPIPFNLMSSAFQWRNDAISIWPDYYYSYMDPLVYNANLNTSNGYTKEVSVDLRHRRPDTDVGTDYFDLNGKVISFYIKLEQNTLSEGHQLIAEVFAKNPRWQNLYGTEVTITRDDQWYKIELLVSDEKPIFGIKDEDFNPEQVRTIGVRLRSPYNDSSAYSGHVFLKDANNSSLPDDQYIEAPFLVNENAIKPYVGLIFDNDDPAGNPNYRVWDIIPSRRKDGESTITNVILEDGNWRVQDAPDTRGITGITWVDDENYWAVNANISSSSSSNNSGEVFLDFRYDLPEYEYNGPLNLLGRELKFRVKAPEGFIGDPDHVSWAQVYVKDEEYDYQYGQYANIYNADGWYMVTLTPQYGDVEGGKTSPDFDPTRIVNIGIKFSCTPGSEVDYRGNLFIENFTPSSVFNTSPVEMLIDVNTLSKYANENDYVLGFEQELGPQVQLAKEHLPTYFKDDRWSMMVEYDRFGKPLWALKGSMRVEHFDNDGRLIEITDPDWGSVVTYSYDDNGNLIEINYDGTREKTREAIQNARMDIETKTAESLYELGKAEYGAREYVKNTIEPEIQRCDSTLQSLYSQLDSINSWKPFWSWDRKKKNSARSDVERAIAQVQSQRQQLVQAAADAYTQIYQDFETAEQQIRQEYETSMAIVIEREENAEREILQQEVEQILALYYTKTLGRNPSRDEIAYWLDEARNRGCLNPDNKVVFDIQVVRDTLLDSTEGSEYTSTLAFNNQIRQSVSNYLNTYLDDETSDSERLSMLDELGLTLDEVDTLNPSSWGTRDVEIILEWLKDVEINFGRCAFRTVQEFLKSIEINIELEEAGRDLILIDILCGAIDCFTEGALEISMYAMNKYIINHLDEINEHTNVSKFDPEDLRNLLSETGQAIVHLDSNHYVIATSIDAEGNITCFETNNGVDGEEVVIDKTTFLTQWTGYTLSTRGPPEKVINDHEALNVRGNLDPFSIFIICLAVVSTTLSLIDNAVCQAIGQILGIATIVFSAISIVANLPAIMTNFFTTISNVGTKLAETVRTGFGIFQSTLTGLMSNMHIMLLDGIANTIIGVSYNIAVSQGLSFFNINSDLARITTSFMTGGFLYQEHFLAGALLSSTRSAISIFGREVGLDQHITDLISTATFSFGLAFYEGGLSALSTSLETTILPNISAELAYIGVQELGETLGVDSRISYLAGIGIRSSLQAGLGTFGSGGNPAEALWKGAMDGLKAGITNVTLQWATQELGLSPFIGSIASNVIGSSLEALLNHKDVFMNVTKRAGEGIMALFTLGGVGTDPWSQAVYISKVLDFSELVREQGLLSAMETYATAIFHQQTIDMIIKEGGILDFVTGRAEMRVNPATGKEMKRLWVTYAKKYYVDIDSETGNLIEKYVNINGVDVLITQKYKTDATGKVTLDGRIEKETYQDGFERITEYNVKGERISVIFNKEGSEHELLEYKGKVGLDDKGNPLNGVLTDKQTGNKIYFEDGKVVNVKNVYDGLGLDIGGTSIMSPMYLNMNLDAGETVVRLDSLNSLGSEVSNADSYLYDSRFGEMLNIAHQYASSYGNMDLSVFGDYGYWDSFEDLAEQYYGWSYELYDTLGPVSIEESSTYDSILNSIEKRSFIDQLKDNMYEMNTFFDFCGQMALKAKGVITEVVPSMFALVKGLGAWEQEAYAFSNAATEIKYNGISFLDKAHGFMTGMGDLVSEKTDILKDTFWTGLKQGVSNFSPYFDFLKGFAGDLYDVAQSGTDLTVDYLRSMGSTTWSEIKSMSGELKNVIGQYLYLSSLELSHPELPFGQATLLNLIGGDSNTWQSIQSIGNNTLDIVNDLYDISSAFVNNTIDFSISTQDMITNSVWWQTMEYGIINTADDLKNRFWTATDLAIDFLTENKDTFISALSYTTDYLMYGQQGFYNDIIAIGNTIGIDFWTNPKKFLTDLAAHSDIHYNTSGTAAVVDMQLEVLHWEDALRAYLNSHTVGLLGQIADDNVAWYTSTNNGANRIAETFVQQPNVSLIWSPGINVTYTDATIAEDFARQLGTSILGKKVVVAHSAGTDSAIRSMLLQKADKYVLMSPRMSPSSLEKYAREAGVDMKDIIVVYAKNDYPHWGLHPFSGYQYPPENGWKTIYIEEDNNVPIENGFGAGHGTPVDALRNNHNCKISINGRDEGSVNLSEKIAELLGQ